MKIHELFSTPDKWTTGSYARDKDRIFVPMSVPIKETKQYTENPEAFCFCLTGAMRKCYPLYEERLVVHRKLIVEIKQIPRMHFNCIEQYNDYPGRTFKEVKELVTRLDV